MKKLLLLFVIVFVSFSCGDIDAEQAQKRISHLKGKTYPLKRLKVYDQVNDQYYQSFFLMSGSTSTTDVDRKIGFSWLSEENQYIYTVLNMTDVRVVIDSTAHVPYIEYEWYDYRSDQTIEWNMDIYLKYAIIHTSDFPQYANLGEGK